MTSSFMSSYHHIVLSGVFLACLTVAVTSFGMTCTRPLCIHSSSSCVTRSSSVVLQAAGMGMAAAPKSKKSKKNKKKGSKNNTNKTPFDANASLIKLEKKYEDLSKANAKAIQQDVDDVVLSEYVVAARAIGNAQLVSDWVPVAQLCMARPLADAEASEGASGNSVQAVVSHYCREIFEAATLGSPIFKSIPRNNIQYSVESMDSFHKHVYETIVEGNSEKAQDQVMTKADARSTLKLAADENDMPVIKKAYRTLSFELHPDRFAGQETEEAQSGASDEYSRVKLAYETLSSGVRSNDASWYESLGGRARTDFRPLELMSLAKAKEFLSRKSNLESAVVGLDPEMVQTFVVRNQAAAS